MILKDPPRFIRKSVHVEHVLTHLAELHDDLEVLGDILDDDALVPERFKDTPRGLLAESDAAVLRHAERVVHRLYLWHRHPRVSPESYFPAHRQRLEVVE